MFENFNKREYEIIKKYYGKDAIIKDVDIFFENKEYIDYMTKSVENDRRGEVAFCVKRLNGKYITTRSWYYPDNIFRVPTGGINYGEDIIEAVRREVLEELGLITEIERFTGVIQYNIKNKNNSFIFYSYGFILNEINGNILEDATEDEVSEFKEVNTEEFKELVNLLESTDGKWRDWCKFRAESTKFAYENLL